MKTFQDRASSKTHAWEALIGHQQSIAKFHLRDLFERDSGRAAAFSINFDGLLVDYSKHLITGETINLLLSLAEAVALEEKIAALFSGEVVNQSEKRPALHTQLRAPKENSLFIGQEDVTCEIQRELERIGCFVEQLNGRELTGASGKPINNIVNIGIGGSDLGPRLAVEALRENSMADVDIAFVANLDARELYAVLDRSDPETTLFIVTSKSFTTLETMENAVKAREWLLANNCSAVEKHFAAVTSAPTAAMDFGISQAHIFQIWEWVGGRYSLWSAVGLPIAIAIGMEHFKEMLAGAHAMDWHFQEAPAAQNIPIILAMLGIWYNNFFNAETQAIVPYDHRLRLLPEYLSQLMMESNGKGVTASGQALHQHSSPVVWGAIGTNAQHAFFQQLHQGTRLIPVEFLLCMGSQRDLSHYHKFVANCIAQSKALMLGQENRDQPYRDFPGNRPSTTIAYKELTPYTLGMLIAMYEHRTFVQAMVWDINPFDQWGVELGKKVAGEIIDEMEGKRERAPNHDSSTELLINFFLKK